MPKDKWVKMECPLCRAVWEELVTPTEHKEVKSTLFATEGHLAKRCYQCEKAYNKPTLKNVGVK